MASKPIANARSLILTETGVIAALNQDKPYDAFVREQIAGDQLGEPIATGFLVSGPNDIVKVKIKLLGLMQRQDELSDIVKHVGTAFLGLTTGCARCHNHKFDPITQPTSTRFKRCLLGFSMPIANSRLLPADREIDRYRHGNREVTETACFEPGVPLCATLSTPKRISNALRPVNRGSFDFPSKEQTLPNRVSMNCRSLQGLTT